MNTTFQIDDITYQIDKFGVINQLNPKEFTYDQNYVSTYDTEAYHRNNSILQSLRWGFVVGSMGKVPKSLLDFGYGNGAFLKSIQTEETFSFGYDISGVKLDGILTFNELKPAEVYTFWDALEHVPDLNFVSDLKCKMICVSLPWCHYHSFGLEWFKKWKHRKPNEHLHHFDEYSLENFMDHSGYKKLAVSNLEDRVRVGPQGVNNILTMAFAKK